MNESKSIEVEVVLAVAKHFNVIPENIHLNRKEMENGRVVSEIDGYLFDGEKIILVEGFYLVIVVKRSVTFDAINQMMKNIEIVRGLNKGVEVVGIIGGPNFPNQIKNEVIRCGLGIVTLNGSRFDVDFTCDLNLKVEN